MSLQALNWAERQRVGSPSAKALLLVLAKYADATGKCWPSQATLAAATELSLDTVQRQSASLEKDGFLNRERRNIRDRFSSLVYQLPIQQPDRAVSRGSRVEERTALASNAVPQQQLASSRTPRPKLEEESSYEASERDRNRVNPLEACLPELRRNEGMYTSWFADLQFVSIDEEQLVLSVSTSFRRHYLSSQLDHALLRIFRGRYPAIKRIEVTIRGDGGTVSSEDPGGASKSGTHEVGPVL